MDSPLRPNTESGLDAQFFSELVKMVDEAEAALTAFEKYTSNESPSLGPIATVCIDGDKLHEGIRRVLPLRDQDPFQRAVFGFRGPQAAVRRPGANQKQHEALHLIKRCAITAKEKLEEKPDTPPGTAGSGDGYVNTVRIQALKELSAPRFDPKRLIRLLEELNDVHAAGCHMATAMVVRSILDHVPPVFELENFSQVGNNFSGTKSFKKSMQHLDTSLRNIADNHLHSQMRRREDLPTFHQVDFRAELDLLIGQVITLLGDP